MLENSNILITGGTGSFGHTFVPMTLEKYNPSRLVIYSRDEMKQWEMAKSFESEDRIRFFIGDVRDRDRLYRALDGVDYVVHAAATKIVPTAEYNPFECIKTNVMGAMNLVDACIDKKVKRIVALSTDKASSASAIQHAVNWMESSENIVFDYVVEIMCTNPLKKSEDIDGAIMKLIKTDADSVIAVHKLEDHHPARIKKIENDFIRDFCITEKNESRRQDLKPAAYIRSGSIYALKRSHIMDEGLRYGSKNSRPYILPSDRAINIDSEFDFELAEIIINNEIKK